MDIQELHNRFLKCGSLSIDSRNILPGSMFVAIKGERFDANTFSAEALEKGASYVVIDNPSFYIDERTIIVANSLKSLQDLAKFHRQYLDLPIVALTGSNGKTTTKELINRVLSKKYRTAATVGNLNNHIGVPLTLLSFSEETEIGIVEMGANHQQEIAFLCEIAEPDFGYITNFGKAHLEGFGGAQGVIKGKSEMYDYLETHEKLAFVNLDDDIQKQKTSKLNRFTFGNTDRTGNVEIQSMIANPFVEITFKHTTIKSHMIGLYNAANIGAAIAIGEYFKVPLDEIRNAIETYVPENNRSQMIVKNGNEIILDAYNANPSSMAVAIDNFIQLANPNKAVVLGDMFELGADSLREHAHVLQLLAGTDFDCHFVGADFFSVQIAKPNFHFHQTFDQLANYLTKRRYANCSILVKGSRGMALERVMDLI